MWPQVLSNHDLHHGLNCVWGEHCRLFTDTDRQNIDTFFVASNFLIYWRLRVTNLRLISLGYLHEHILVSALLVGMVDFAELAVLLLYLTHRCTLDKYTVN